MPRLSSGAAQPRSSPQDVPRTRAALRLLMRLMQLIRPYWGAMAKGFALGFLISMLGMAPPYLAKLLVDEVYTSRNLTLMHVLVLGTLAVGIAQAILGGIRGYFNAYTTSHLSNETILLFFNHLQHLPVRFFDKHRVGEVMSRFGDVRSSLATAFLILETLLVKGAYLILVPPFLFVLQWKLALVALATVPLSTALTAITARMLQPMWKRSAEGYAELSAIEVEVLSHIRTLKVLGAEHHVFQQAAQQMRLAVSQQLRAGAWGQMSNGLVLMLRTTGTAIYTWYGWKLILAGEMSLGDFLAFTAYVAYLYNPLQSLSDLLSKFQQAAVSLGRMFEYLDVTPEQDPKRAYSPRGPLGHRIRGDLSLRGVTFGYSADKQVLADVDLHFATRTVTAIVGPSGAGKSSLLRLLTRLEEPDAGGLFVDGMPASTIPVSDYRRQVSAVWQEFALMQGTIWDNLTLGAENPTRAQVDDAVRLCRLDTLLAELPMGYDTPVGEWGATLSGGQRQRIALARAIIRDTPVLLLDEATSNVDLQTENVILQELFELRRQTVVWITHRVQSAALADRVCVVDAGRVVAVGTHAGLLRESDPYRKLQNAATPEDPRQLRAVSQAG